MFFIRPKNGLNKRTKIRFEGVDIIRDDSPNYDKIKYDLCIFRRGSSIGKEKFINLHTQTYKIIIKDKSRLEEIKKFITINI